MVTRRPRARRRCPRLEAVSPLPSDEATPPVTKTCLVGWLATNRTPVARFHSKCRGEGPDPAAESLGSASSPRDSTLSTIAAPRRTTLRRPGCHGRIRAPSWGRDGTATGTDGTVLADRAVHP